MAFISKFINPCLKIMGIDIYSLYLNKVRKNLAANLDRSPLIHSHGYASADDQSTLFAKFPLNFVPFVQYAGGLFSGRLLAAIIRD